MGHGAVERGGGSKTVWYLDMWGPVPVEPRKLASSSTVPAQLQPLKH